MRSRIHARFVLVLFLSYQVCDILFVVSLKIAAISGYLYVSFSLSTYKHVSQCIAIDFSFWRTLYALNCSNFTSFSTQQIQHIIIWNSFNLILKIYNFIFLFLKAKNIEEICCSCVCVFECLTSAKSNQISFSVFFSMVFLYGLGFREVRVGLVAKF